MGRRLLSLLTAVALASGVLGCGGEDPPPDEPIDELVRYLPAGSSGILAFADFAAAREQLGLPADADTLSFEILADDDYDPEAPEARLLGAAGVAMSVLGIKARSRTVEGTGAATLRSVPFPDFKSEPTAVTAAFDGRAIAAAATGGGDGTRGTLTAIRTSQPFDELAGALAIEGYEREGNVLSKPAAEVNEVADAGDGVVVLSTMQASAAEAVADPGGGPAAALALLEPADEPIALVIAGLADDCVTGYGGWQDASGASGDFVIATDGPAELERVELEGFDRFTRTDLGEPRVEDSTVEVPFSGGARDGASPVRGLMVSLGRGLYDCG